jgi:hypothetical protein
MNRGHLIAFHSLSVPLGQRQRWVCRIVNLVALKESTRRFRSIYQDTKGRIRTTFFVDGERKKEGFSKNTLKDQIIAVEVN